MKERVMKGIYKIYSCPAGEHLVLGELLKRKYPAYLANGKTQPCWDIIIIKESKVIKIQVKTIDWPNKTAVNGNFEKGFDYLIIVLLNSEKAAKYLIIPRECIDPFLSEKNPDRKDNKRTLNVSKNFKIENIDLASYANNWELIK
jgi:hypothetical protein